MYEQRRPMAVGDMMEAGFRVLAAHWQPLLLVHALGALPGLMFTVATSVPEGQDPSMEMMLFSMASMILVYPLATGAGIKVAADALGGQIPTVSSAIEHAAERYASLLWAGLLMGLFVVLGFMFLVLPGLYVALRLCFTNHAATLIDARGGCLGQERRAHVWALRARGPADCGCAIGGAVFGYGSGFLLTTLNLVEAGGAGESSLSFEIAVAIANVIPAAYLSVCLTIAFLDRLYLDEAPGVISLRARCLMSRRGQSSPRMVRGPAEAVN